MDEPTSKPAFNKVAPKRIVKVTRPTKKKKKTNTIRSKPDAIISLDPAKVGYASVMTLDVEKYLHQFKDFVMTEEEKIEVLNQLWNIMCRFVELGFGMDSQSLACEQKAKTPRIKDGVLVNLDNPEET